MRGRIGTKFSFESIFEDNNFKIWKNVIDFIKINIEFILNILGI